MKCAHAHHKMHDDAMMMMRSSRTNEDQFHQEEDIDAPSRLAFKYNSNDEREKEDVQTSSKRRVRDSAIQIELKRKKAEVEELQRRAGEENNGREDPLAKELKTMASELAKLRTQLKTYKVSEQTAISEKQECEKTLEY